jgi:hypothetical protein
MEVIYLKLKHPCTSRIAGGLIILKRTKKKGALRISQTPLFDSIKISIKKAFGINPNAIVCKNKKTSGNKFQTPLFV